MDKGELLQVMDEMKEMLGADELLEAIARALSSDELEENLRFIDRCYETQIEAFDD